MATFTGSAAITYSVLALSRDFAFHTGSYDLVTFGQAVRPYAHFEPGISIIKGMRNEFGLHFSVLGDHWSPLTAILATLYWIHDSSVSLLWLFTRRAFGGGARAPIAACLVVVAYALSWREQRRVALLERRGYEIVFDRRGYPALHRSDVQTGASSSAKVAG